MSIEQIITYIILPVFGGIGALWAVIAKLIIPAILDKSKKQFEAQLEERRDLREYHQTTESDAFKQVLKINEELIKTLISSHDKLSQTIENLEKTISALQVVKTIADVRTQIEISNRDRARVEEIISDIDLELHEIKAKLK